MMMGRNRRRRRRAPRPRHRAIMYPLLLLFLFSFCYITIIPLHNAHGGRGQRKLCFWLVVHSLSWYPHRKGKEIAREREREVVLCVWMSMCQGILVQRDGERESAVSIFFPIFEYCTMNVCLSSCCRWKEGRATHDTSYTAVISLCWSLRSHHDGVE